VVTSERDETDPQCGELPAERADEKRGHSHFKFEEGDKSAEERRQ